jgi:ATP-dependent RNA helicase RhlE
MTFNELPLSEPLLKAIHETGYTQPTPIQQQAIPLILDGKDILGCAQTGTGKTAAFALPILQRLSTQPFNGKKRPIRALILTPTRELAIQIEENIQQYGTHVPLNHTVIFGGVNQNPQVNRLNQGTDILVATPGRLLDLMGQGYISLKNLSIFVLDEADRMLDMGFVHDVKKILAVLPKQRQSLFFSATMPPTILKLASTILTDPAHITVTPVSSTAEIIDQSVYFVEKTDKGSLLVELIKDKEIRSALVFTRTKHGADRVSKALARENIKAEAIHGNKSQNARQRALTLFKDEQIQVLVATDIAARGIDVNNLDCVINYEIPNVPETYVHRIGRTGRAGALGRAFSFCDTEERAYIRDIEKLIGKKLPVFSTDGAPVAPQAAPSHSSSNTSHQYGKNITGVRETSQRKETSGKTANQATEGGTTQSKRKWQPRRHDRLRG